ncbi:MAG TPA: 2-phospho-L-lactate guanylyltransferase [Halioglobus sp.]
MAQALVPLKDLVQAKSRLAGLLRPSERRALAQAMVEDVLTVLSGHTGIARITLVSDDPGAGLLAQKYRADCWSETSLGCRGLNAVVRCASERLLATGEQPLLVLHGDLPLLTLDDISAVLAGQRESGGLIIGCDRRGTGTNLLAFNPVSMPDFCFGADSCAGHTTFARRAGVPVLVLQRVGMSVDVDEAPDLHYLMQRLHLKPASYTAQLLHNSALGARVALALAAMLGDAAPDGTGDTAERNGGNAN